MIKLIGIALIVAGFAFRLNALLAVLAAGLATGLAAGFSLHEIVGMVGKYFVESRTVTLPIVLMYPVIGLLERHGLKERAETLIRSTKAATAGRVVLLYTALRQISISLGVNIGGHAGMVRPLVAPMAEAAARTQLGDLPRASIEQIRAHAAAGENIGNFFGEDIFIAVGAILLMKGFFDAQGIPVSVWAMALWGAPTAFIAFVAMAWRCWRLDHRLAQNAGAPLNRTSR